MGLFSKSNNNGGIMDAIRCDEKNYLIWKWRPAGAELGETTKENAIRWGSAIRVKEGSVAVFVYSGKEGFAQDYILGPADTIVDTKNLPVISSIIGLAYNGSTPFQAEVYFINLAETVQTKFAVPYFDVFDTTLPEFSVPVAVRGSIDFNIQDYQTFIDKHRLDDFSMEDLQSEVKDAVTETVKHVVGNAPENYNIPVIQLERKISEIKRESLKLLSDKMNSDYGVALKDINIAGLEIDKESEGYKELKAVTKDITTDTMKAKAKINIKDMKADQKIGVFGKAANLFVDIKENAFERRKKTETEYAEAVENERAGKLGAAGAKIIGAFKKNEKAKEAKGPTPPPLNIVKYYVAVDEEPTGPYSIKEIKKMISEGTFKRDSLVWREGMDEWSEAELVEALAVLFE